MGKHEAGGRPWAILRETRGEGPKPGVGGVCVPERPRRGVWQGGDRHRQRERDGGASGPSKACGPCGLR